MNCGECSECCKGNLKVTVKGRKLQPGRPCRYLSAGGCSIHRKRPKVCRRFHCGYLLHNLPADLRPDRCGAMVVTDRYGTGVHSIIPTGEQIPDETHDRLATIYPNYVYRWRNGENWKLGLYGTDTFKARMLCQIGTQTT